jgi:hypothetical protein
MSKYRTSNLLYRPSLSIWTARIKDKSETVKVNANAGAVTGAANVNKQLLPDSPELLSIQKWASSFRTWIYLNTLPWDDTGWRIGRVDQHIDFMAAAGDRMREGDTLVDSFCASYRSSVEEARFKLANMFNDGDYPGEQEVRAKFAFAVDVMPIGNADDFRVVDGLPPAEVDKLVAQVAAQTEQKVADAMREAFKRLFEVVSKVSSTLTAYGNKEVKKFNDTLIGNISDLVAVMPALNLTNNPMLIELTADAERLATYDLGDLRKNDVTRGAAIKEAEGIAKKFRKYLGEAEPTAAVGKPVEIKTVVKTPVKVSPSALIDMGVFAGLLGEDD